MIIKYNVFLPLEKMMDSHPSPFQVEGTHLTVCQAELSKLDPSKHNYIINQCKEVPYASLGKLIQCTVLQTLFLARQRMPRRTTRKGTLVMAKRKLKTELRSQIEEKVDMANKIRNQSGQLREEFMSVHLLDGRN